MLQDLSGSRQWKDCYLFDAEIAQKLCEENLKIEIYHFKKSMLLVPCNCLPIMVSTKLWETIYQVSCPLSLPLQCDK